MNNYSFEEHIHNFAVWTAARAVSRNFTSTIVIKEAIAKSGLRDFSKETKKINEEAFALFHRNCSKKIQQSIYRRTKKTVSYGRAAKIISVYLKTAVILPKGGRGSFAKVIHPPIDSILLKTIASKRNGLKDLATLRWTQLTEKRYWTLVDRLTAAFDHFDWRLEMFWKPERE